MRIDRLAWKNLNSLRGEFRLDFDQSPLAEAGIFAITGPTGAGKSTILDAICVALYGQTPRLGPGNSAELLTRNSGECYAEVEFSVAHGRYRSRWSRRRARGRGDGNLQPTSMELVELGEGGERIIEDQVRQVVERVEALTGLDFARFTRSVLLAQGSFASFLKAKENERAELLERMTGTRIYSFISMAAFDRARDERQRLDELLAVNAHLDLLPVEQLAALQTEAVALEQGIATAEAALAALRVQEATAIQYAAGLAAIRGAEQELAGVLSEQEALAAEFARLAAAETAWPLQADLRSVDELQRRLAALEVETVELRARLERLRGQQEVQQQAQAALDQEAGAFAESAAQREQAINEAEKIDQQMALQGEALAARRQVLAGLEQEMLRLAAAGHGQQAEVEHGAARVAALDEVLRQTAVDAGLGRELSLMTDALRELADHRQRFTANRREQEALGRSLAQLSQEADRLRQQQAESVAALAVLQEGLSRGQERVAALLKGRTCDELEQGLAADRKLLSEYEAVCRLLLEAERLERELTAKDGRRQSLERELNEALGRRQPLEVDKEHAEGVLVLLEEKQALAVQVANYEADRQRLTDGAPCPLCGAQHHPWQSGAPQLDAGREAVLEQRRRVADLIAELGGMDGRLLELEAALTASGAETAVAQQALDGARADLVRRAAAIVGLAEPGSAPGAREVLAQRIVAEQEGLAAIRQCQSQNETLLRQLLSTEKAGTTVMVELEKALALSRDQQAALLRYQEEEKLLCQKGAELGAALTPQLDRYGLSLPGAGQEEASSQFLRQRWLQYDQARQERAGLEASLAQQRQAVAVLASQQHGLADRKRQEEGAAQGLSQGLEALAKRRFDLLGDETVEAARRRLAEERDRLGQRRAEGDQLMHGLLAKRATQAELLSQNGAQMERLAAEAQAAALALDLKREAAGFADLLALRRALLPDAELQALRGRREAVILRRQRLEDRLSEARGQLAGLGVEAASLDLVALQAAVAAAGEAVARQQQDLGGRREIVRRQGQMALEHEQRALAIDRQRQELRRWQLLSDLVGSADGKKFRRFAQGLTLDHLISLANRQLVRLSDRYLLRRHQSEELGLEVVDTYQADAIRPTGTLSGGEEFLVSLALALGLANLSGQTRIDSLFLDEGFGTLDTDTLETALAALAALQETGKTIGIISHVDALKERIPVQIRLHKLAGGFSAMTVVA